MFFLSPKAQTMFDIAILPLRIVVASFELHAIVDSFGSA
jgi:hypothetical protein